MEIEKVKTLCTQKSNESAKASASYHYFLTESIWRLRSSLALRQHKILCAWTLEVTRKDFCWSRYKERVSCKIPKSVHSVL